MAVSRVASGSIAYERVRPDRAGERIGEVRETPETTAARAVEYGGGVEAGSMMRREARAALELFAACGFAIAQPVLSVYGKSADTFIYRDVQNRDIVLFALALAFAPPVALWVVEVVVGLVNRTARRIVHAAFLVVLAGLFAVQLVKHLVTPAALVVVLAAGVVAGFVALYAKTTAARQWLLFVSPAPILFVALFVFSSSVTQLVFPKSVRAVTLGSVASAPSVVMITFDEWPTASFVGTDGGIDRDLFPNIAAFADTSTWYRNETSVTNATWHAVPSILTGMYPEDGSIPEASSHPENLFTFLGGSYRLDVSESVTRLCPKSLCAAAPPTTGSDGVNGLLHDVAHTYKKMVSPAKASGNLTAGFQEAEDSNAVSAAIHATGPGDHADIDLGAATANRPQRFAQFLQGIRAGEKPTLHFLHILLPHVVYRYLPNGQEYAYPADDFAKTNDRWSTEAWPVTLARERLELQAMYVDRLVGELTARLRSQKMLDESVVVLTADHGITFTPGEDSRGLGAAAVPPATYPQLLWAPLFVKASGQTRGTVSDENVMTIDILPTIAKLTGFTIPWKVDGVPAGTRTDPTKVFVKSTVNAFGVGIGKPIRYDGAAGEKAMLAVNVGAFARAPAGDALRAYRVGPDAQLIGKKVTDVTVGAPADNQAALVQYDALKSVDTKRGTIPALVWGTARRAATVVIALNGTIAGVSPTFADGGTPHRFAMMLPETLLRSGDNHVAAYELESQPGVSTLDPIVVRAG